LLQLPHRRHLRTTYQQQRNSAMRHADVQAAPSEATAAASANADTRSFSDLPAYASISFMFIVVCCVCDLVVIIINININININIIMFYCFVLPFIFNHETVAIEHRAACALVMAERMMFGVRPDDVVYQGFSISFDASVEEVPQHVYSFV
jgi:hypothetical protein